mmetsp:Transcript_8231/g.24701  ORF Transcript_8231/g.24701 Transcript_8231/m.24701 type:complete len:404 (+) Transcript_8231:865-2076(+)
MGGQQLRRGLMCHPMSEPPTSHCQPATCSPPSTSAAPAPAMRLPHGGRPPARRQHGQPPLPRGLMRLPRHPHRCSLVATRPPMLTSSQRFSPFRSTRLVWSRPRTPAASAVPSPRRGGVRPTRRGWQPVPLPHVMHSGAWLRCKGRLRLSVPRARQYGGQRGGPTGLGTVFREPISLYRSSRYLCLRRHCLQLLRALPPSRSMGSSSSFSLLASCVAHLFSLHHSLSPLHGALQGDPAPRPSFPAPSSFDRPRAHRRRWRRRRPSHPPQRRRECIGPSPPIPARTASQRNGEGGHRSRQATWARRLLAFGRRVSTPRGWTSSSCHCPRWSHGPKPGRSLRGRPAPWRPPFELPPRTSAQAIGSRRRGERAPRTEWVIAPDRERMESCHVFSFLSWLSLQNSWF